VQWQIARMTLPDRYRRRTPRSRAGLFLATGGWFVLLLAAVAVAVGMLSREKLELARRMETEAVQSTALLTSHRVVRNKSRTYYVTFVFRTAHGELYQIEHRVSKGYYQTREVGSQQPIRYLPDAPSRLEATFGETRRDGRSALVFSAAMGLGASVWFGVLARKVRGADRARRFGARQPARVTAVLKSKSRWPFPRSAWLQWEEADGRRGRSLGWPQDDLLQDFAPGDTITVLRHDGPSWWEADVGPREMGSIR